ncbi:ketol-acid reductoisomerase [Pseudomonas plecoglossicida]|uniref:ketol-acid reductoisomerase n=1 Tax=Pseudomonas plecoglossicida TaxID=70775 RepID=UPI003D1C87B2
MTNRNPEPLGTLIDTAMIHDAVRIERCVTQQGGIDAPSGESYFVRLAGSTPVIVTAPHATEILREGQYRFSDGGGTAALAHMLHRLGGATVIYTQYRSPSDANYCDDNDFKRTLAGLIEASPPALLLDIHASHDYRPYDVDIGTMHGESLLGHVDLLSTLVSDLQQEGILNLSHDFFGATRAATVTHFTSKLSVPAIQLEISSTWLRPSEGGLMAHRFAQMLQALSRYVRHFSRLPEPVLPR